MILYGASGHGKVIYSIKPLKIKSFFDDSNVSSFMNLPVHRYDKSVLSDETVCVTIGDNSIRKRIVSQISHAFGNVFSPRAIFDESLEFGFGNQIVHGALIQVDVRIGSHCIINSSCSIDHDCKISDFVHIAPNSTLCGNVKIGEGTLVGAGAVVLPNITIGDWCIIGAGSVVTKDVSSNTIVVGNPARKLEVNG